ncbi:MAG: putative manganese transporter [Candidatus Cryptobacteroides sp.]
MIQIILDALKETVSICLLVMLMMTLIEVFNVTTRGKLFNKLSGSRIGQVVLCSILGVLPGCLGGFAGVSLYSHRMVGFGSLLAMLIATAGDESILMLSLFPGKAVAMFAGLFCLAVIVGIITEYILDKSGKRHLKDDRHPDDSFEIHECDEDSHETHHEEGFRHKLVHFFTDHLWKHVIKRHLPSIFAWTFGVLLVVGLLSAYVDIEAWIKGNTGIMILIAVLVGLIPQSGPHIVFVTMFAGGMLPFSVLLANTISQDGHACLPLIAENKRSFAYAKLLKSVLAIAAGFIAMMV